MTDTRYERELNTTCPTCGALPSEPCKAREQCPRCGSYATHETERGVQTIEYRCDSCKRFFRVVPDCGEED